MPLRLYIKTRILEEFPAITTKDIVWFIEEIRATDYMNDLLLDFSNEYGGGNNV